MTLTIMQADNQEPLIVLDQDEQGIRVSGGDPQWAEKLKLDQFNSLKDIADYINHEESDLQAVFQHDKDDEMDGSELDAEGGVDEEGDVQEPADFDTRIQPALDIIKQLLSNVQMSRATEQAEETNAPTAEAQESIGVQPVEKKPEFLYVSLDGDNIGNAVARAEEKDDEQELAAMSAKINAGQDILKQWADAHGGQLIEAGGDEGLVKVPDSALDEIETLRENYAKVVGATCSVGVGMKISESTKARMLAKLRGKNQTVVYDESVPQEIELRMKDQDTTEAHKLQVAMRPVDPDAESARNAPEEKEESRPKWAPPKKKSEDEEPEEDDTEQD